MLKYWFVALIIGSGLCTFLDHQHVVWGVLAYTQPDYFEQAWWVPLLFFVATLAGLWGTGVVRRLVGGEPAVVSPALALVDVGSFAAAYYLTAVAHHAPDVLTGILAATWLLRAFSLPGWAVAYCIATALVGPAVEATLSALGGFHYLHPDFLGVARWLPVLYLHVGVVAVSVASLLREPEQVEIEVAV
jgi:hypothetical protein